MYRIVFHNNEAMATTNLEHNQFGVEFTDAGKNTVYVPYQAIKVIVKTYEEEKQEDKSERTGTEHKAE